MWRRRQGWSERPHTISTPDGWPEQRSQDRGRGTPPQDLQQETTLLLPQLECWPPEHLREATEKEGM